MNGFGKTEVDRRASSRCARCHHPNAGKLDRLDNRNAYEGLALIDNDDLCRPGFAVGNATQRVAESRWTPNRRDNNGDLCRTMPWIARQSSWIIVPPCDPE